MTRLTPDLIEGVPGDVIDLDSILLRSTGKRLIQLSLEAAGLPDGTDLSSYKAAVIPITSGLGVIGGFSQSVDAILRRLGVDSHITSGTDVLGFSEAVDSGADLIMMADDSMFVAYNVNERKYISNFYGTALGYANILDNAVGGVSGKDVLVIGAGCVGSRAARILRDRGASVSITDKLADKGRSVAEGLGVTFLEDIESAIGSHRYILNAAPASFPGSLIMPGSVISTPGVPHHFDDEAWVKAKAIIHDPLEIGVATMVTCSLSFSTNRSGVSK